MFEPPSALGGTARGLRIRAVPELRSDVRSPGSPTLGAGLEADAHFESGTAIGSAERVNSPTPRVLLVYPFLVNALTTVSAHARSGFHS